MRFSVGLYHLQCLLCYMLDIGITRYIYSKSVTHVFTLPTIVHLPHKSWMVVLHCTGLAVWYVVDVVVFLQLCYVLTMCSSFWPCCLVTACWVCTICGAMHGYAYCTLCLGCLWLLVCWIVQYVRTLSPG
jgi:hypothetical protein